MSKEIEWLPDTTSEQLEAWKGIEVVKEGLWFNYDGIKTTPKRIYFGISYPPNNCIGGDAYCHYDNALRPIFTVSGEHYNVPELRNVVADYDGKIIKNFRKE